MSNSSVLASCPRCESFGIPAGDTLCPSCRSSDLLEIPYCQWQDYLRRNAVDAFRVHTLQLQVHWEKAVLERHDLRPDSRRRGKRVAPAAQYHPDFDLPDAEARIMGPDPPPMPHFHVEVDDACVKAVPRAPRLLTPEEQHTLIMQMNYAKHRGWDEIAADRLERIVRYNLRMAMNYVMKHGSKVDLAGRYSGAAMAIMWAAEDFDPQSDGKFSTYATHKLRGAWSHWAQVNLRYFEKNHQPIINDDGREYNPFGEPDVMPDMDVHDLVASIPNRRSRDFVTSYYGLNGKPRQTLKEIGDKHGLTRERVRQVLALAYDSMRARMEDNLEDCPCTTDAA